MCAGIYMFTYIYMIFERTGLLERTRIGQQSLFLAVQIQGARDCSACGRADAGHWTLAACSARGCARQEGQEPPSQDSSPTCKAVSSFSQLQ